ncbi:MULTISPECIES: hypothetical protein [Paraburkholderia]|uniref:TonB C-terminal domain-containing protein n=1 Tax=Paraburkholderia podalyriae TaxID=1938811 RepID=A0ABR7PWY8_9BURK|nr:hypothetical protein [Paraburkholderia podalyriae]MBC8750773.1 hypothetical protein [Paraburkholderia podalyriae]
MTSRGRIGALFAALLALVSGSLRAQSDVVTLDKAPQAWVVYAQRVSQLFQTALESDAAHRVHARFEQSASGATGGAPPVLRVKAWFEPDGRVSHVEFDSLGDNEADAELRQVLLAQNIGAKPPHGMAQPLVVRLMFGAAL